MAATIDRFISKLKREKTPNVKTTSWNKAIIAPKLNCHSNLIQIYINIAVSERIIAITPDLSNSELTFGPTFSTLLKLISDP